MVKFSTGCAMLNSDRWFEADSFHQSWDNRAREAARLLRRDERTVCEIGCGARQALRSLLPNGSIYRPADLNKWSDDTEVCDLNAGQLPESSLLEADACFLLGVAEYINDVPKLLRDIHDRVPSLIVSYCSLETHPKRDDWINHYTEHEFARLLGDAGFSISRRKRTKWHNQALFRASRRPLDRYLPII
jgi:hypothetical protein